MSNTPPVAVVPLHPHDGFDWQTLRTHLGSRTISCMEHLDGSRYSRFVTVHGQPTMVEICFTVPDGLMLVVRDEPHDRVEALTSLARRALSLDATEDAAVVREHFGGDPDLGPLVAARPHLRTPGTWDGFESGVRAIVGQQVSVAGATTITARIVERHGAPMEPADADVSSPAAITRCFPRPEVLADRDLTALGLTNARMATIRTFAAAVVDGTIRLDTHRPHDEFVESVVSCPGLGPWTAHYLALRLGYRDAFPASDLALRRALDATEPPSARELAGRAEAWRPWRALAAAHLWTADAVRTRSGSAAGP